MKKVVPFLLSIMMVFAFVLPSKAEASGISSDANAKEISSDVDRIEQYVFVDENGHIGLIPEVTGFIYKKYNLDQLNVHFDLLNDKVDAGVIKINKDLSITDLSISTYASYSKWEYHWWGYDRKFNNSQAKAYANDLTGAAAVLAMGGSVSSTLMPIIGAGVLVTAGYYTLLSSRVIANNKGKGVYVGMTWARVFNVKPL